MATRVLYFPVALLAIFLAYTIYSQDLKIKDIREYNRQIVIYTQVRCSYCTGAKSLLDQKNIPYQEVDLTWDKELHSSLETLTNQSTVPYIYINGQFIGGFRELLKLDKSDKLSTLLK